MPLLQPSADDVLSHSSSPNPMFNPDVLAAIKDVQLPEGLTLRPLDAGDYDKGYLNLLSQLTVVGAVSREQFDARFRSMQHTQPKAYYVVVIEDESTQTIVGSATLVVEWKFIHSAGCRGRVEDVVVDKSMRGRKLGGLLNSVLVGMAKNIGVYKLSLECKDALIPFYELYGFKKDVGNNFLVQRFDDADKIDLIPTSNL